METPNSEQPAAPVTAPAADVADVTANQDIADILGDYKTVEMTIDPPKADGAATPDAPGAPDLSDPAKYFQSGKKKGQPKPQRGARVENTMNAAGLGGGNMSVPVSDLLTGALFISMIDILVPLLIEVVNNKFSKEKIKASDLTLTAEQQKRLSPIADELVKRLNLDLHPGLLLILGLAGIYGLNYAAIKSVK